MKKLYLYIRLSDADDDLKFKTESESIANQRTLLYRFIRARREFDGYEVVEFIDDGYSGTNGNRPSFERMIESLKNGEANVVICKDFSRFSATMWRSATIWSASFRSWVFASLLSTTGMTAMITRALQPAWKWS